MGNPLQTLLITRPEPDASHLAQDIRAQFIGPLQIIISPLLTIRAQEFDVALDNFSGVIFTSTNGVKFGPKPKSELGIKAFCVGAKTAEAATAKGYVAISANGNVDDLARLILSQSKAGPLLHLRGVHSRGDLAETLKAAGREAVSTVVYRQSECLLSQEAVSKLVEAAPIVAPVYSPKTAKALVNQGPWAASVKFVAISQAVADVLAEISTEEVAMASSPDGKAMINAICSALRGNSGVSSP